LQRCRRADSIRASWPDTIRSERWHPAPGSAFHIAFLQAVIGRRDARKYPGYERSAGHRRRPDLQLSQEGTSLVTQRSSWSTLPHGRPGRQGSRDRA
jgi:hypothetical protein